mmetsp:Transcript_18480/g.51371  ORF Transcript_18480/g.51371 Transcript_18480/m.51371 type:complete len:263 (+) Transcript_18480:575-1363(+)
MAVAVSCAIPGTYSSELNCPCQARCSCDGGGANELANMSTSPRMDGKGQALFLFRPCLRCMPALGQRTFIDPIGNRVEEIVPCKCTLCAVHLNGASCGARQAIAATTICASECKAPIQRVIVLSAECSNACFPLSAAARYLDFTAQRNCDGGIFFETSGLGAEDSPGCNGATLCCGGMEAVVFCKPSSMHRAVHLTESTRQAHGGHGVDRLCTPSFLSPRMRLSSCILHPPPSSSPSLPCAMDSWKRTTKHVRSCQTEPHFM